MPLVFKQDVVFDEAETVHEEIRKPLQAAIIGPRAELFRYSDSDEKAKIDLGAYDHLVDTTYSWPSKPSDSIVDTDYVKLFIDKARLRYYTNAVGGGDVVAPVSGQSSRIRAASTSFRANGSSYPRSSDLLADVEVGDVIHIRGASSGKTLETTVQGFIGETIPAVVKAAAADPDNLPDLEQAVSVDKIAGLDNAIMVDANVGDYDGREDGAVIETYTIRVTKSSTGGDLTTAKLRVTSASGTDDVDEVTPAAVDQFTAIGTRGLLVRFSLASGSSFDDSGEPDYSNDDLLEGQAWEIHIQQEYTPPVATSGGSYLGSKDTTYIVEVTKGGPFSNEPEISVTTSNGYDFKGPVKVTSAGSAVSVGNYGVTISFSGTGLNKGDKYTIEVEAEDEGAYQTLVLAKSLDSTLQGESDLEIKLYIEEDYQIARKRTGAAPQVNWEASQDSFTVKSGITATHSRWVDSNGVQQPLPVEGGTLYLEYRAWRSDDAGVPQEIEGIDDLEDILGDEHPDNPLAYAVGLALRNTDAQEGSVTYSVVADPDDDDSWQKAIDALAYRGSAYGLVPLTQDEDIIQKVIDHVESQSVHELGLWRCAWVNYGAAEAKAILDATKTDDSLEATATLKDDPDSSGTQYTYLEIQSNNADLIDLGVKADDVVRFLYQDDGWGDTTWTEFKVASVVNGSVLKLSSGHSSAVNTASKFEIWRTPKVDEVVSDLIAKAESHDSNRVVVVWPDTIDDGVKGYHACAALAGLRSAVAPHRALTGVEVAGISKVDRSTRYLNAGYINQLAEGGVWVLTQDKNGIYTHDAVTTIKDFLDYTNREEMIRANLDAIRYVLTLEMRTFLTQYNLHAESIGQARTQLESLLETLRSSGQTDELGGMIQDYSILQLRRHATNRDRLVMSVIITLPIPFSDRIDLTLVVQV